MAEEDIDLELDTLLSQGRFEEAEQYVKAADISEEDKRDILTDVADLRQSSVGLKKEQEKDFLTIYSNLITTTTDIIQQDKTVILTDKQSNRIGVAIDGNEKTLLDYYSTEVYNRLTDLNLTSEKLQLVSLIRTYGLQKSSAFYKGYINGRAVEFYAIGNNGQIKAYAMTLKTLDGQDKRLIIDNASYIALFFDGLKNTFPTTI